MHPGTTLTDAVRAEWPTPQSREGDGSARTVPSRETAIKRFEAGRRNLDDAVAIWPTLSSRHGGASLPHYVLTGERTHGTAGPPDPASANTPTSRRAASHPLDDLWPTPQAYQAPAGMGQPTSTPLDRAVLPAGPSKPTKGGKLNARPMVLNPRWVLLLMGFPPTYLDGVVPPSARRGTR